MELTNFLSKTKGFLAKRVAEFFGLILMLIGILLFISILSYSPNDPNFLVNENNTIKNLLGIRGSIVSDFLFQSIGLISYIVPITFFFSGTNHALPCLNLYSNLRLTIEKYKTK